MNKIKWGILSTATIAVEQVIPAMQLSELNEVYAVASRDLDKARAVANKFDVPTYFGSYEAILSDPKVQAVYIPLPNHMHVEWAIKSLRAGKHVLVEKPMALNAGEAQELMNEARMFPHLKVMEGYMYKFHPQWIQARKLIREGAIGSLKLIQSSFSFFDDNPESIVNSKELGGGSLMDVGCYPLSVSRFLFDAEPHRVISTLEYHPEYEVDITASGVLEFDGGRTVFFSSIQLMEHQEVRLFGTEGILVFEVPFNPPSDRSVNLTIIREDVREVIYFGPCNQYTLQADSFAQAILEKSAVPYPLADSVKNMKVIDAIQESGRLEKGVKVDGTMNDIGTR